MTQKKSLKASAQHCFQTFAQKLKILKSDMRYIISTTQDTPVLGPRTVHKPCQQEHTGRKKKEDAISC